MMLASCVRKPLRASSTFVSAFRSFSTQKVQSTSKPASTSQIKPGFSKPIKAIGFPLTPLDDKYARFRQTIEKIVVPSRLLDEHKFPSGPFIADRLFIKVCQRIPQKITQAIDVFKSLSDAIATTGPIKLNIGQLYITPSQQGNEVSDLKSIVRVSLRPTLEQSEQERFDKLFRTITDKLYSDKILANNYIGNSIPSMVCMARFNTAFDITALVELLEQFGTTDISGLIKIGGAVNVDLGNFEINEVILQKLLWSRIVDPASEPLASIKL
ncbi:hypothetical protein M422DRAFT_251267 [Sphaerobolus stellatus SS14]|uniref:Uncharacterized protein n=1 Tax=Sphaerobolus stellatus (strain SS14) TaxID=990650 RepID=A0A0C9UQ68_SPHS4|nr:hypothetical protein M422DRAFT_251267 [Sphaerobolus stellatus SS14]